MRSRSRRAACRSRAAGGSSRASRSLSPSRSSRSSSRFQDVRQRDLLEDEVAPALAGEHRRLGLADAERVEHVGPAGERGIVAGPRRGRRPGLRPRDDRDGGRALRQAEEGERLADLPLAGGIEQRLGRDVRAARAALREGARGEPRRVAEVIRAVDAVCAHELHALRHGREQRFDIAKRRRAISDDERVSLVSGWNGWWGGVLSRHLFTSASFVYTCSVSLGEITQTELPAPHDVDLLVRGPYSALVELAQDRRGDALADARDAGEVGE